jgi:lipid-binding SYLF domain-containing protein
MSKLARFAIALSVIAVFTGAPALRAVADDASDRAKIDTDVKASIAELYKTVGGSKELAAKAKGILVFPSVYKAGFGVGAQYGKGALLIKQRPVAYYSTAAASFGFQAGAQERSLVFMFMTDEALHKFQNTNGWDVGGDATVTAVKTGVNGAIDFASVNQPVVAIAYANAGLMADLSLKGTKVSKLDLSPSEASGSSTR